MVEKHVLVICVAVGALALAAAALGILGEAATKSKSFVRYDGANCVYRRTPAFGCGVAAAAALLTGQLVLTASAGCWDRCRTRPSDHRRTTAVFSSILSWFLAALAASAFVVGAVRNESGERRPEGGAAAAYYQCTVLVAGVFAGGSFLSLLAAAVGIASYVAIERAAAAAAGSGPPSPPWSEDQEERRIKEGGGAVVAMDLGQPQLLLQVHRQGHGCLADCSTSSGSVGARTVLELFEDERRSGLRVA